MLSDAQIFTVFHRYLYKDSRHRYFYTGSARLFEHHRCFYKGSDRLFEHHRWFYRGSVRFFEHEKYHILTAEIYCLVR